MRSMSCHTQVFRTLVCFWEIIGLQKFSFGFMVRSNNWLIHTKVTFAIQRFVRSRRNSCGLHFMGTHSVISKVLVVDGQTRSLHSGLILCTSCKEYKAKRERKKKRRLKGTIFVFEINCILSVFALPGFSVFFLCSDFPIIYKSTRIQH
jgi:hypothetical protein